MRWCSATRKRVSAAVEPEHFVVLSLPLSLIWLALFAYHLTARLRIKYSAFSMKMNMYVRTLRESFFFFGFNRLEFRLCLCVQCCQFLAVSKNHIFFHFSYSISLSVISRFLPQTTCSLWFCKNGVFFWSNDEYFILTCRFFSRHFNTSKKTRVSFFSPDKFPFNFFIV